jgi:mycofactocin system glycosyltransferase
VGAGGRLLTGGAPPRQIRLSATGAAALAALLAGDRAPGAAALGRRLVAGGTIHPLAAEAGEAAGEEGPGGPLTVVVPVRDGGSGLGALLVELRGLATVIVVDDGSADGSAAAAAAAGARVLANEGLPGPAGARNTGLRAAATELVAFVDADCSGSPGWAGALAALLAEDLGLALVAPRVHSAPGPGPIARYESGHSPLDLGPQPGLVGPGRRLGFVPSTALVGRRSALLAAGGFDERLRFGEDVDLVLRLLAAGWRVRYSPEVGVRHRPRPNAAALARQRCEYGGSAAVLDRRHPGAVAPVRLGPHTAVVWAATVRNPLAGAGAALVSAALAARGGSDWPARRALAALALSGHGRSLPHLARLAVRDWLPLTAAACLLSPAARRRAGLALALDTFASRRPDAAPLAPPLRLGLRALDASAYAAGLWRGAAAARSPRALLPGWRKGPAK